MEVLDPSLEESFLPSERITNIAEAIARSAYIESLCYPLQTEENEWLQDQSISPESIAELRRVRFLRTISHVSLLEILSDYRARSETHLAGETCRINAALFSVMQSDPSATLSPPPGVDLLANLQQWGEKGHWQPFDTAMTCPTIDGCPPYDSRELHIQGRLQHLPALHHIWYDGFINDLSSLARHGQLQILEPPFSLIGGNIIAGPSPRFFTFPSKQDVDPFTDPAPTTPELLLV